MNNEKECTCKVCKPFKDQPEIKYVNRQSEIERLEKENTRLDEENHKLAYTLTQSVPVESSLEQYDRIKELEKENAKAMEVLNSEELLRQHMNFIGYRELDNLREELKKKDQIIEKAESALRKTIESAEFFMSHADCRKDTWSCKCSFCLDTESSKNIREAKQYFQDKDKE